MSQEPEIKFVNCTDTIIRMFADAHYSIPVLELAVCATPVKIVYKAGNSAVVIGGCHISGTSYVIENLPKPVDNVYYIVSYEVMELCSRNDLIAPDDPYTRIVIKKNDAHYPIIREVRRFKRRWAECASVSHGDKASDPQSALHISMIDLCKQILNTDCVTGVTCDIEHLHTVKQSALVMLSDLAKVTDQVIVTAEQKPTTNDKLVRIMFKDNKIESITSPKHIDVEVLNCDTNMTGYWVHHSGPQAQTLVLDPPTMPIADIALGHLHNRVTVTIKNKRLDVTHVPSGIIVEVSDGEHINGYLAAGTEDKPRVELAVTTKPEIRTDVTFENGEVKVTKLPSNRYVQVLNYDSNTTINWLHSSDGDRLFVTTLPYIDERTIDRNANAIRLLIINKELHAPYIPQGDVVCVNGISFLR